MLTLQHRRYETRNTRQNAAESDSQRAGVVVSEPKCDYPRCKCAFLWCEGKHPPCPVTGKRHPEMLK
jgi:hypothetical protein